MKQPKGTGLEDRRKSSADAKLKLLNKFKAAPKADDPEMLARRTERQAMAEARDARHAERDRLKQEQAEQKKAETAARDLAERETREAEDKRLEETAAAKAAERKAERDRKYAARKARKR